MDITPIDENTFQVVKTITETKSYDQVNAQLAELELHKSRLIQEKEHYEDLIAEDQAQIDELTSVLDNAKQKTIEAKIVPNEQVIP